MASRHDDRIPALDPPTGFGGRIVDGPDHTTEPDWPTGFGGNIVDWPDHISVPVPEGHIRVEKFLDGDDFVVLADLPEIDPDRDVRIKLADHTMLLNADRRRPDGVDNDENSNLYSGHLSRVIGLPPGTIDRYTTTYSAGMLMIRFPVARSVTEPTAAPDVEFVDAA